MKLYTTSLLASLTALLVTTGTVASSLLYPSKVIALFKDIPREQIDEVWQIIDRSYYDGTFNQKDWQAIRNQYLNKKYQTKEEVYKGIRLMLKNLNDPYTRFMDPKEFQDIQVKNPGQRAGVGLQLSQGEKTKKLVVITPIEDSPAAEAGISTGDILIKIDGKGTAGMTVNDAIQLIRGKEGTKIKLTIQRDGRQVLNFNLLRKRIEIHPVEAKFRPNELGGIGYIRLKQFSAGAASEMAEAIKKIESQGANGYVLDLRSNPGGLLYSAIDTTQMWLNEGRIVSIVNRQGGETKSANSIAITNKPLVVLVDGGSASASEILTAALQENKRAKIVGTKTFGQAVIQSVRPLADGSALAVTTAKYLTPSGKDLHNVGIIPDVEVKISRAQIKALVMDRSKVATAADPQYAKAVETLQIEIANRN